MTLEANVLHPDAVGAIREMVAGPLRMWRRLMDRDEGSPSVCDDKEDQL